MHTAPAVHTHPRPEVLTKALLRAGERLGLNQAEIGRIIGLSPASVSRMRRHDRCLEADSKSWELAALLVRLYRSLDALMGGDLKAARAWLRSPNRDLGGTPLERLASIEGLVGVVGYLDSFRAQA